MNNGMDPTIGDQFHEPPYNLYFYQKIINNLSPKNIPLFFIVCDIITTLLIYESAKSYLRKTYERQCEIFKGHIKEEKKGNCEPMDEYRKSNVFLRTENIKKFAMYCALFHLFNPYSLLNCVAQTTTVVTNIMAAALLYGIVTGKLFHTNFLRLLIVYYF